MDYNSITIESDLATIMGWAPTRICGCRRYDNIIRNILNKMHNFDLRIRWTHSSGKGEDDFWLHKELIQVCIIEVIFIHLEKVGWFVFCVLGEGCIGLSFCC